ncbi:dienelactone hydrolase family protein [Azospirillum sp.]|uniref:dienelactone hydrolase family protein n=1 Tax=Azospirillum sp. TaxID=34012 RepID=UPI003D751478
MRPVTFPSFSPCVLTDVLRPRARRREAEGLGYLFEPFGPSATRVLPAVVLLPDLDGPKPGHEFAYAEQLARRGYVAMVLDPFVRRGCRTPDAARRLARVSEAAVLADAFAALRQLAGHPRVDPARVAALGFGYGGTAAVMAAYRQLRDLYVLDGLQFAAHVSYYGCPAPRFDRSETTGAPVLLLLGEVDEAVSIRRSRDIAADLRRGGSPVNVRVYPETAHAWDAEEGEALRPDLGLAQLRLRVTEDHRMIAPWSGIELRGPLSRRVALWMAQARAPYLVQKNAQAKAWSDDDLAQFLAQTIGEPAALIRAGTAPTNIGSRTSRG